MRKCRRDCLPLVADRFLHSLPTERLQFCGGRQEQWRGVDVRRDLRPDNAAHANRDEPSSDGTERSATVSQCVNPTRRCVERIFDSNRTAIFGPVGCLVVNTQTVILSSSQGPIEATIVPAEGGIVCFITTQSPLATGTTFSVSVDGAKDWHGMALPGMVISFTTAGTPAQAPTTTGDSDLWVPTARILKAVENQDRTFRP